MRFVVEVSRRVWSCSWWYVDSRGYNTKYEKKKIFYTWHELVHFMNEKIVHVVFPSLKMDHAIPDTLHCQQGEENQSHTNSHPICPSTSNYIGEPSTILGGVWASMDSDIEAFQEQYGDLSVIIAAPRPLAKSSDWEAVLDEYIVESRELGLNMACGLLGMIHFQRLSSKRPLPVCHIRIVSFGCL